MTQGSLFDTPAKAPRRPAKPERELTCYYGTPEALAVRVEGYHCIEYWKHRCSDEEAA